MKKIKTNNKLKYYISLFIFPSLFILLLFTLPTNFNTIKPGSYNMILDNGEETSNFYSLYVKSYSYTTPFQRIFLNNLKFVDYSEKTSNNKQYIEVGNYAKDSANIQSVLASTYYANKFDTNIELIDYYLDYLYVRNNIGNIKIGSKIIQIDDILLNNISYFNLIKYIKNNKYNHLFKITLNNNEVISINSYMFYDNFYVYPIYKINENINYKKTSTIGPSAGLIYTIKNYVKLTNLNIKEDIISATGTINYYDEYNIKVGMIGGLKQKIYGLRTLKPNHLFIPLQNKTSEIELLIDKYLPTTNVYFIDEFIEVVNILNDLYN